MTLRQILLVAAGLPIAILPAHAGSYPYESNYTSIKERDCATLESDNLKSVQSCPGFANIGVEVIEIDLRQSIRLRRTGIDYPLDFQSTVSPNMSVLGSKIEWRFKDGKREAPFALITRLNVSEQPEKPEKTTSYLIIAKIAAETICVVGTVPPQPDQNKKARAMADHSADLPCVGEQTPEQSTTESNNLIYFDISSMKWRDEQGICHTCTEANGFPAPVVQDGFYFDSTDGMWHDGRDGATCHTCTPENGFSAKPVKAPSGAAAWPQDPTSQEVCTRLKDDLAPLVPSPLKAAITAYNKSWPWLNEGAVTCIITATKVLAADQGPEVAKNVTSRWQGFGAEYTDGADGEEGTVQVWKKAGVRCLLWVSYLGASDVTDSLVVACQGTTDKVNAVAPASTKTHLSEEMPGWCKNEVLFAYDTYMADISITETKGSTVKWRIKSTGSTGKCLFDQNNNFERLVSD